MEPPSVDTKLRRLNTVSTCCQNHIACLSTKVHLMRHVETFQDIMLLNESSMSPL